MNRSIVTQPITAEIDISKDKRHADGLTSVQAALLPAADRGEAENKQRVS